MGTTEIPKNVIVHLGLGAFHRTHQAVYTQLATDASPDRWMIEAVAMRNRDLADALNRQGGRYHLLEADAQGSKITAIDVIDKAYHLPSQAHTILQRFADEQVKLVTLTVTEKGYCFSGAGRELDFTHGGIVHDLQHPDRPTTAIGLIVSGLAARRHALAADGSDQKGKGITLISCDNLEVNGDLLKGLICGFANRLDANLARWIEDHCRFPNTMVDRITPAPSDETRQTVFHKTGHRDALAVAAEPFSQWVIEDDFAGRRPDWEKAGVMIVPDVRPFELTKLRMLNGAHSLIAYLGTVFGYETVSDVMDRGPLATLVASHMNLAATTLPNLPQLEFGTYRDDLVARFRNPVLRHQCRQIAMDGSQKMPLRIFAPAREILNSGGNASSFALASALWIAHLGLSGSSSPLGQLADPLADDLTSFSSALSEMQTTGFGALFDGFANLPGLVDEGLFSQSEWRGEVAKWLSIVVQRDERLLLENVTSLTDQMNGR